MGAMVTIGYTQARAWGVGMMAGSGTTFGVAAGGVIEVIGGSIASIAGVQNYAGTGNFHVSAGQLTFFAQPRYSTQVVQIQQGAGFSTFNGGGQTTNLFIPQWSARVVQCNICAATEAFLASQYIYMQIVCGD